MSITFTTLIGVLFSAFSFTNTPHDEPADTTLQFDEIVVTASKIPVTERETTKPVIVINRAEIEQSGSRDLGQLLQGKSGIRVNQSYGGPAENTTLFMQGAGNRYTLFLIDGLAVNDPSAIGRAFDLRMISLESVERIEIIKGSQSTLYGTDAVAGVVNIITNRDLTDPVNVNGSLSYGRYNTLNSSGVIDGRISDNLSYQFSGTYESTDGFSAAATPEDFDPTIQDEFEADGFDRHSFSGRVNFSPFSSVTITPFLTYSSFTGGFDTGAFQDGDNRFEMDFFNPGVNLRFESGDLQIVSGYNYSRSDRLFQFELFDDSEFSGKLHNTDTYAIYSVSPVLSVLGGFNYQNNRLPGAEEESEITDRILSPYATILLKNVGGFNAELGARLNSHSEYGNNTTFSFAPSYFITPQIKLFASFTTGFTAPTLDELFGPFGANEELDPERSRYISAGAEFYALDQRLKLSGQYFNRQIDDVIVFATQYENRDRQNDSGIELQADLLAGTSLRLSGYYNYVTGELTSVDPDGNEIRTDNLLRRPTHSLGGSVAYNFTPELLVRVQGEFNSDRTDSFFNPNTFETETVTLDAYTLFNLYAEYSLMENRFRVFSDIRNLFNTGFTEVYGFNTTGFNASVGVRFGF